MAEHPCPAEFKCPACGQTHARTLYTVSDTNERIAGRWNIAICEFCGCGALHPLPDDATVDSFYRNRFYTNKGQRFHPLAERLRAALARLRGRTLNRLCPARGLLMDFGAGAGHFARAQERAGWAVHAVDPFSAAADQIPRASYDASGTLHLDYSDRSLAAVSLWYVLEHLRHPRETLREITRVLAPDGVLLIAVQNFASLQRRVFGPRWLILDPPRHLWHFAPEHLDALLAPAGFRRVAIEHGSWEMGPYTILQSLLNLLVGNRNSLFRFLRHRGLGTARRDAAEMLRVAVSLALLPLLLPVSLAAYLLLLALGSGDVFTVYYRRDSDG